MNDRYEYLNENENVKTKKYEVNAESASSALRASPWDSRLLDHAKTSKFHPHHDRHHHPSQQHGHTEDVQQQQQHRRDRSGMQHQHRQQPKHVQHQRDGAWPTKSQQILHAQPSDHRLREIPSLQSCESVDQQRLLRPTSQIKHASHHVRDRQRNPRLSGADLYVARLCGDKSAKQPHKPAISPTTKPSIQAVDSGLGTAISKITATDDGLVLPAPPASLHDELTCSAVTPPTAPPMPPKKPSHRAHASRPCYRCISYMHAVGIKRVFWTNQQGQWEGDKVTRLVAALEGNPAEEGATQMYATKHEVLMMRRVMGGNSVAQLQTR